MCASMQRTRSPSGGIPLHAHGTSPSYRCMCSDWRVHDRGTRSMAGVLYILLPAEHSREDFTDKFLRYQLITLYIC